MLFSVYFKLKINLISYSRRHWALKKRFWFTLDDNKISLNTGLFFLGLCTHTHTHIIYIYICICVCECVCATLNCRGGHYTLSLDCSTTLDPYLIMLSVKQRGMKYHFLSLSYDSTRDWTLVFRTINEHSNNGLVKERKKERERERERETHKITWKNLINCWWPIISDYPWFFFK